MRQFRLETSANEIHTFLGGLDNSAAEGDLDVNFELV
jgi:hypothetical protein